MLTFKVGYNSNFLMKRLTQHYKLLLTLIGGANRGVQDFGGVFFLNFLEQNCISGISYSGLIIHNIHGCDIFVVVPCMHNKYINLS